MARKEECLSHCVCRVRELQRTGRYTNTHRLSHVNISLKLPHHVCQRQGLLHCHRQTAFSLSQKVIFSITLIFCNWHYYQPQGLKRQGPF